MTAEAKAVQSAEWTEPVWPVQSDLLRPADALLRELAEFCLEHGGKWCYVGWPLELLESYLREMARRKAMTWVSGVRCQVLGVGVAWRCWEWEVRAGLANKQHTVDVVSFDPEGDSVFFADFVVRRGVDRAGLANGRAVMVELLRGFGRMWPGWRVLKWWTFRRGKLRRLDGTALAKRIVESVERGAWSVGASGRTD